MITQKHFCKWVVLAAFGVSALPLAAQLNNDEVVVIKEYEGAIQDANKLSYTPLIPETPVFPQKLDYKLPQRDFKDFGFTPNPLKAIGISKEKSERYHGSFIKLGFGSQVMPLAEVQYNDNKTKDLKFGLRYKHLSAMDYRNKAQRFNEDEAGIYVKWQPKKMETGASFDFRNLRTHFYGFTDTVFERKDVVQRFREYDGKVYLKNALPNDKGIDFNQAVQFNYLQEAAGKANEWFMNSRTDFAKNFLKHHNAYALIDADYSQYAVDSLRLNRLLMTAGVGYFFNNNDWLGRGGIALGVDGKKVYALPELYLQKRLYENAIIVYGEWKIEMLKNSFNNLSHRNNFLLSNVELFNSRKENRNIGIKGTYEGFNYNLQFSNKVVRNMPLFVNATLDEKRFDVVYEPTMQVFNFHFEAGYMLRNDLTVVLTGDYNNYRLKNHRRAWHEPAFISAVKTTYNFRNKMLFGVDVYGITGIYARVDQDTEKRIKGMADINLRFDYIFNRYFSFFAMGNNLANFRFERWRNYPTFGAQGVVGAKFSF